MTLAEAAERKILRVRRDEWLFPNAYLRQDLFEDGSAGPWLHLFNRTEQEQIGQPTPQDVLRMSEIGRRIGVDTDFVEYTGALDPADTWPRTPLPLPRSTA